MEQFISEHLMGEEIEVWCVGGGKFSGFVRRLVMGVVTLEWEDKETYVSCDKIIAAWSKKDKERLSPSIGFSSR